jgi:hypothetical protein
MTGTAPRAPTVWPRVGPIGIVERAPVYTILAWQIFNAVVLLTRPTGRVDKLQAC